MSATLANWKPRELVLSARQQTLEEFVAACETPYLLMIRIEDPSSELAIGLATQEPRGHRRDGLGFRTVQRNISSVLESLEAARKATEQTLDSTGLVNTSARLDANPGQAQLAPNLLLASYHVLPLCKRSEAAFLRSISVGRARNHDIVLRHRSVSKFHGSFELDDQERVFVRDANSSNHTFVNGRPVLERAELHSGDNVQFGSVEALLCAAEVFWRTVHS